MFRIIPLDIILLLDCLIITAATIPLNVLKRFPWSPSGRIVGGKSVTIQEVPYQISIRSWGSHMCGGTIISRDWIATAAHCTGDKISNLSIYAGSANRFVGGSIHSVAAVIVHENYGFQGGMPINDIALMKVKEPFQIDATRQPVALIEPGAELSRGSEAVISGWGTTGGWSLPTTLRAVRIPIVDKTSCRNSYQDFGILPPSQICAAIPEGGKDACQGDSGGPLVVDGRLAGITSWGNGCALPGRPGVYTEVAAYRQWVALNSGV